jgi:hypothetical protein
MVGSSSSNNNHTSGGGSSVQQESRDGGNKQSKSKRKWSKSQFCLQSSTFGPSLSSNEAQGLIHIV